jgi:hypothetical protein
MIKYLLELILSFNRRLITDSIASKNTSNCFRISFVFLSPNFMNFLFDNNLRFLGLLILTLVRLTSSFQMDSTSFFHLLYSKLFKRF